MGTLVNSWVNSWGEATPRPPRSDLGVNETSNSFGKGQGGSDPKEIRKEEKGTRKDGRRRCGTRRRGTADGDVEKQVLARMHAAETPHGCVEECERMQTRLLAQVRGLGVAGRAGRKRVRRRIRIRGT